MTFFTTLGIVVSILGGFFLLTLLVLGWRVRRGLKQIARIAGSGMLAPTPARVHLQPREKIAWDDEAKANAFLQSLWRLGFQDAGSYEIPEMPGVKVRALARPEEHLWSLVYEHPIAGVWMDFVTRYADGGSLTTANARHGDELEHRPAHDKIYAPELDAEALYQRHLAERRAVEYQEVAPENFSSEFEKAYADEMDWRLGRGMVTDTEIRALAAKSGQELSDEEMALLRQTNQSQASAVLSEAIRDRFLQQTPLSAAEWEKLRTRIVIIHDRMTPETVRAEFQNWSFDSAETGDEELKKASAYPPDLTPCRGFEYLNSTLPATRRFEKIVSFAEPVPADVYQAASTAFSP